MRSWSLIALGGIMGGALLLGCASDDGYDHGRYCEQTVWVERYPYVQHHRHHGRDSYRHNEQKYDDRRDRDDQREHRGERYERSKRDGDRDNDRLRDSSRSRSDGRSRFEQPSRRDSRD